MSKRDPYSWYSKYWDNATAISEQNQRKKTEPKIFRDKVKERDTLRKERDALQARILELKQEIFDECPHKVKYHELESGGREDDYGSYQGGNDYVLHCTRCEERIAKWGLSENFFGVDKSGKPGYGPKLEYYKKRYGTVEKWDFRDAKIDE